MWRFLYYSQISLQKDLLDERKESKLVVCFFLKKGHSKRGFLEFNTYPKVRKAGGLEWRHWFGFTVEPVTAIRSRS